MFTPSSKVCGVAAVAASLLLSVGASLPAAAQNKSDAKPATSDQKKNKHELEDVFKKWLKEDVSYIITPEERDTFLKLQTDEEREQFIEQFWLRRDPDPSTPEN